MDSWLVSIDLGALFFFQKIRDDYPWSAAGSMVLTHVGSAYALAIIAALAALVFFLAKRPRTAFAIVLSAGLGGALVEGAKFLVHRERQHVVPAAIPMPTSLSFPSGHALGSMAVFGILALTIAPLCSSRFLRRTILFLGFFLPILIGATRLLLGVHYLFDVAGGWIGGLACVLFAYGIERKLAPPPAQSPLLR